MASPSSSAASGPRKHGKNAFFFVIITVFIDLMAFAVIMPSMPMLMAELLNGADNVALAKAAEAAGQGTPLRDMIAAATPWGGFISTVYAIMNFLAQPVLGGLSDRFGRRPVLLMSMAMLALDFVIMGLAHTVWLLFIGRFLSGISAATHATASAYIADTTEPHQRAQAFGMLGAAFGVGFTVGPVIGGLLGQFDARLPFFAAAALAGVNFFYGLFVLPESLDKEHRRKFDWKRANAFGAFAHFAKIPYLAWFLVAMLLFNFAHLVFPITWNYYGAVSFGWDPNMLGLSLAAVGVGSAIVQGGLMGPAMKRFGATRLAVFGFLMSISIFIAYAIVGTLGLGWVVFIILPIGALGGVLGPAMNHIMTARVPKNAQGELQGAIWGVNALASVFGPIALTQTFYYFTSTSAPVHFPGAAFALSAVVCIISLIPLMRGLSTVPKVEQQPPDPPGETPPEATSAEGAAPQTA